MTPPVIRPACDKDIALVHGIYSHHVRHGTASWEISPPSLDEMTERFRGIAVIGLPYLVADWNDNIVGFAYAGPFRPREGYRYTVEDSIYIAEGYQGQGLGRALLTALIDQATSLGYRQMIAVIGDSANQGSMVLHQRLGFAPVGRLHQSGFKFGRWLDTVFMQRALGEGGNSLPPASSADPGPASFK